MKKLLLIGISLCVFCASSFGQASGSTVAVMPMSVEGAALPEKDVAMVEDIMQDAFVKYDKWIVLTRSEIDRIVEEYRFQATGIVSDADAISAGNMLGAEYVCQPKIIRGDYYSLMSVLMISVHTGRIHGCHYRLLSDSSASSLNTCARELVNDLLNISYTPTQASAYPVLADDETYDVVEEDVQEEALPYQLVEEKPLFLGGDANTFATWVNQRLVYPVIAQENGVGGTVTLQFTIEKNGEVTGVKVLRGVDPALDAEAVRVVSSSPKWKPGTQRGRFVSVTYTFPVIFQLR